ncbi:MAG: alpha/beta hydrolase [Myxococcota bacterium]|jgi:pimeloyl-ACP methyl ester carboxylesterase|nr:alpha/beta hydrolase [Myxococcota bacterium]
MSIDQDEAKDPVAFTKTGEGPAVILSHGLGDSAETWTELLPHLEGCECWTWDMLGHGASPKPTDDGAYSMQRAIDDLEGMIERVGRDVVLIGHSLGGYLSQHRAVRDLANLRGLVLIATGPGYRDPERREEWNSYVHKAAGTFDIPAPAMKLALQHDELVMNNLEAIRVPVMQVLGSRDKQYHIAFELMKKRLPWLASLWVDDAGHHVHRSHADIVGPAIRRFIEGLGADVEMPPRPGR